MTELLRATIFHTPRNPFQENSALEAISDGGLLIESGRVQACGNYAALRDTYPDVRTRDLRGGFLLPGFVDSHVHYPQLRILGGLGYSLFDWLEKYTLPEEVKFAAPDYAESVATEFTHALVSHGTTTALVFGAHFVPATAALFRAAENAGLRVISGLVISDRHLRPELHTTPEAAYYENKQLISCLHGKGKLLYAVTPRFALSS
ncbi:MAG: amidohydrolase family protein, partial [Acidobacteriia bacterium]|nr:amidohydrolase family protein [Terriglobia bacterium]